MRLIRKIAAGAATLAAAGTMLVTAVPSAHAATGVSYLRQGSYGPGVACAQWAENWFLDPQPPHTPIDVDGDFGPATHNETVWFQEQSGLSQDGVIGPRTGDSIMGTINAVLHYDGNMPVWNGYNLSDCYRYVPTSS